MSKIIQIAEAYENEDGSHDYIVEVNDPDTGVQYSRTPFHFYPGTSYDDSVAYMVEVMSVYLDPAPEPAPPQPTPLPDLVGTVIGG